MTSAPYEASKGAVSVFTKMFAKYGASRGVLVNAVCPAGMRTRMRKVGTPPDVLQEIDKQSPLQRTADPIEVARMVVWLCGDENTYATGAAFDIVWGPSDALTLSETEEGSVSDDLQTTTPPKPK